MHLSQISEAHTRECRDEMKRSFLEFFAGIGLIRVALERRGWKCLFANDNDLGKTKIYMDNYGIGSIDTRSIEELSARDVPSATLATASFPCQDLSEAGPRRGIGGPRSAVFWHFVRILREMRSTRPPLVLLENVRGFLTGQEGRNLRVAVKALNDLGYACDVVLVDAKYFVPQSRPRVFVSAIQESVAKRVAPSDVCGLRHDHPFRTKQILRQINSSSNLKWLFLQLPPVSRLGVKLEQVLDPPEKVPSDYWFSKEEIERHLAMMPSNHKKKLELLRLQGRSAAVTMYRRIRSVGQRAELRFDGIAGCLRTPRGGSSKQFVVILDKETLNIRKLTIPEMSRLMGLPESFILPNKYLAAYKALGDAVAVPAVEWVADSLLEPLVRHVCQTTS